MKAAVVTAAGQPPVFTDFDAPKALADHHLIDVRASALSVLTRIRAAGRHYSSTDNFPFIAGVDGTGRLADGRRVYFVGPRAPFGALAERTLVPATQCIPLPATLDDVTAAAIANPGMSSWLALTERAHFKAGQTILINGATGTSGKLAIQIAKHMGARRIIATGRNVNALEATKRLGADATIPLQQDEARLMRAFATTFQEGVDVVLDYLWGTSARTLLIAATKHTQARPVCFVQIGSISGEEIALPSAVLRAAPITLLGSGFGSVSLPRICQAVQNLFEAVVPAKLEIATNVVPLSALAQHWTTARSDVRTVFTIGTVQ